MAGHGEPIGHMLDDMCFLGAIALTSNGLIQPWVVGLSWEWSVLMILVGASLQAIGLKINSKRSYWEWLTWEPEARVSRH